MRSIIVFMAFVLISSHLVGCASGVEKPAAPGLLTDQEVEAILTSFPYLGEQIPEKPTPKDILQQLKVDTAALKVLEQYEGDCLSFTTYQLSPSYVLLVDENACFGYRVSIYKNQDL
jgi:hypothetical protein